jgi:hypothetical protein
VALVILVAAGAATASSGAVRHQLALSFSKEPRPYVEVFVSSPASLSDRGNAPAVLRVPVTIRSHGRTLVGQQIALRLSRSGRAVTRATLVDVPRDGEVPVTLEAPVPRGDRPWVAVVSLTGRPERLLLHGPVAGR